MMHMICLVLILIWFLKLLYYYYKICRKFVVRSFVNRAPVFVTIFVNGKNTRDHVYILAYYFVRWRHRDSGVCVTPNMFAVTINQLGEYRALVE